MKCLKCNSEWSSNIYNKNTCPFCGEVLEKSEASTIERLRNLAESGDSRSQYRLGYT